MGYIDNISAVRGDLSNHSMNIFVEFFKMFPQHQNVFGDYKGKDPESLKSLPKFKTHTTKVVTMLLDVLEKAGDSGSLQSNCQTIAKMGQHKSLTLQHYKDLGTALMAYLQKTLGGACDTAGWEKAYNSVTSGVGSMM
ncbi:hypothetical protein LSH36_268g03048 [Paralvinella palmiformis]